MNDPKKTFPLRVLLTVTTGRFLCQRKGNDDNGIGDLYALLNWMTNDELFTHQLPRAAHECKPWLLRWFPELSKVDLGLLDEMIASLGAERGVEKWTDSCYPLLEGKTTFDVPRIPADDHEKKDPYDELVAMRGTDEGIVVVKDGKVQEPKP